MCHSKPVGEPPPLKFQDIMDNQIGYVTFSYDDKTDVWPYDEENYPDQENELALEGLQDALEDLQEFRLIRGQTAKDNDKVHGVAPRTSTYGLHVEEMRTDVANKQIQVGAPSSNALDVGITTKLFKEQSKNIASSQLAGYFKTSIEFGLQVGLLRYDGRVLRYDVGLRGMMGWIKTSTLGYYAIQEMTLRMMSLSDWELTRMMSSLIFSIMMKEVDWGGFVYWISLIRLSQQTRAEEFTMGRSVATDNKIGCSLALSVIETCVLIDMTPNGIEEIFYMPIVERASNVHENLLIQAPHALSHNVENLSKSYGISHTLESSV